MSAASADDVRDTALSLLEELVGFDTVSAKTNLPLIDRVEAYLAEHDIKAVRVPNATGDKAALLATVGPEGDGGVVLSGHTDVVPVKGQKWSSDPFKLRRDGDRLYGRGACDMKAFDALCLAMLPRWKRAGLARPIHLLLSYDEEIGCRGSLDTIARFGDDLPRPGLCIVGEPTKMAVVDAHKSISHFETYVHGKEAHSSDPRAGANAVEIACDLVTELYRLQGKLEAEGDPSGLFEPPYSTVHVGIIEGGNAGNILARDCRFVWEFRGLPGVDPKLAATHLQDYVDRVALPRLRRYTQDASIEIHRDVEVPGLEPDHGSEAEVLAKRLTGTNAVETVSFATEAGQFQKAGIPTIVCGPGSIAQAHQPDEYIELSQIDAGLAFLRKLGEALA
ncbi:Acetylornithine deacetylase [Beijerinckiaceae bacterium RH AL1]|nr:acetylornithine deacetylase [Beijerinckiaceae bacterium]VVB49539.1 Acetylornithine deacetylase [Beijerinckiaceae bacterium RH CH11]VVB49619.1 Acetylornithine deacetylase [Beijerinckiaceae bacterium RH AL8]VVC56955.1 Acetylornithine deacetylase [Beijerinckiaceae bacterium RH AL1]